MRSDEAIVLAGGLGTRLRALVSDVPKPMAPVAGRPFLEWVLRRLAQENIRRVILATGYMSEKIERAFGSRFSGMEVVYSVEPAPLGTGGAIAHAARLVGNRGVHVVNGDTFLEYSLVEMEVLVQSRGRLGMALAKVDDVHRYGAIGLQGDRVASFHEKGDRGPGWINGGCYFFPDAALRSLPSGAFSLEAHVLAPAAAEGDVVGLTRTGGFIDIGVPEDYVRAQAIFGAKL